jgi:hypothetical protein
MKLENLIDNATTDKNSTHSYLDTYETLFSPMKDTAQNILEIGVQHCGSIKLWNDYFTNANIYGLDINEYPEMNDLRKRERVNININNAYNVDFIKTEFIDKNIKFDVIIDDGPHSLESMKFFAQYYSELLNVNGVLIIEDVQDINWVPTIINSFPSKYKDNNKIYSVDLRKNKCRYDDILIVCKND